MLDKRGRKKHKIPERGDEFDYWTVCGESFPGGPPSYNRKVPCICVCGRTRDIYYMNLINHRTKSCGCMKRTMMVKAWKERKKNASG